MGENNILIKFELQLGLATHFQSVPGGGGGIFEL